MVQAKRDHVRGVNQVLKHKYKTKYYLYKGLY